MSLKTSSSDCNTTLIGLARNSENLPSLKQLGFDVSTVSSRELIKFDMFCLSLARRSSLGIEAGCDDQKYFDLMIKILDDQGNFNSK